MCDKCKRGFAAAIWVGVPFPRSSALASLAWERQAAPGGVVPGAAKSMLVLEGLGVAKENSSSEIPT